MADVFLSYRNTPERRAFVKRLALLLRAHEVSVWWDYGLEAGESYRSQITEELSAARIVAPLWCSESIHSKWVKMEAELGKDKLVPARLQKVVPPAEFEAIQSADLIGWDGAVQHPRVLAFVGKICERLGKSGRAPIDMMEELADLRTLPPLPEIASPVRAATTASAQDVVLADLRATWVGFPARDSSASVEKFLARVRGTAPGSGLEFEVEHALDVMRTEGERREQAKWAAEESARREVEARAAEATEEQRRRTPGAEFRDAEGLPLMVTIPSGRFGMGSPETENDRMKDEGPQQEISITRILAVGKFPVTLGEWRKFVEATAWNRESRWSSPGFSQDDTHPVTWVNWVDAITYCDWAKKLSGKHYRLLAEAEWEYACRAGTETRYSFGDYVTPEDANFNNTWKGTTPVGDYPANQFGLHDMHGNVAEWCADCYRNTLKGQPTDGEAFDDRSCAIRVSRGGSWYSSPLGLRSADRSGNHPSYRSSGLGFRLAKTIIMPEEFVSRIAPLTPLRERK